MKKLAALLMAIVMVLSVTACGGGNASDDEGAMITAYIEIDYPDGCGVSDVEEFPVEIPDGTNAMEMLQLYADANNVKVTLADTSPTIYVTSIGGVAENADAGWVYEVNDEMTMDAADQHIVKEGQMITWEYMTWSELSE